MFELITVEYMLNRDLAHITAERTPRHQIAVFTIEDANYRRYQRSKREINVVDTITDRRFFAGIKLHGINIH